MRRFNKSNHYVNNDKYRLAHRDIVDSLSAFVDEFDSQELYIWAKFFDNRILKPVKAHDILTALNGITEFKAKYDHFNLYDIRIASSIKRLYYAQLELDNRKN